MRRAILATLALIMTMQPIIGYGAHGESIAPPKYVLSIPKLAEPYHSPAQEFKSPYRMMTTTFLSHDQIGAAFVAFLEIRDSEGVTVFLQFHTSKVEGFGRVEMASSWLPPETDNYELRAFAISNFTKPEVLVDVTESQVTINIDSI